MAVFDVVSDPSRDSPLVLLQPQSRLQDVLPAFDLPSLDATYVGIVQENGALFAMSPTNFPLVVFHEDDSSSLIYKAGGEPDDEAGSDLVPWRRRTKDGCKNPAKWTRECLVGVRPVEDSGRSRFNKLLDGVPSVPQLPNNSGRQSRMGSPTDFPGLGSAEGNTSGLSRPFGIEAANATSHDQASVGSDWTLPGIVAALLACVLGLLFITRRNKTASNQSTQHSRDNVLELEDTLSESTSLSSFNSGFGLANGQDVMIKVTPPSPSVAESPMITPLPSMSLKSFSTPPSAKTADPNGSPLKELASYAEDNQALEEDGDDSDREGEVNEAGAASSGRKRGTRRRKRGKKNKGGANKANGDDAVDAEKDKENVPLTVEGEIKKEKEWEVVDVPPPSPSSTPVSAVTETAQAASLIVSEEILGMCLIIGYVLS